VGELFPRLRRWWDGARLSWSGPRLPYAVTCGCGNTLFGQRRHRHQVVHCPKCGKPVFILPNNVYPAAHVEDAAPGSKKVAPASRGSGLRAWRLPLLAALTTLLGAVVVFLWVWPHLGRQQDLPKDSASPAREKLKHLTGDGQRALAEGSFDLSLEKFTAAVRLRDGQPGLLDPAANRRLNQLYWQSDLLANQLDRPLAKLLEEAESFNEPAGWTARFKHYHGKSVVFCDEVYLDPQGRPSLLHDGEVTWKKEGSRVERRARIVLAGLKLLSKMALPHERPAAQRWIFGARLASFTQQGDEWVIRLEPDSGVLLTDGDAVKAWRPGLKGDPTLVDVLERQAELSEKIHVPEP
jgi:hypothetical protein